MNNDEIKALLRELKERSDENGEVKSRTVRISFEEEEPERPSRPKKPKFGLFSRKKAGKAKEENEDEAGKIPEESLEQEPGTGIVSDKEPGMIFREERPEGEESASDAHPQPEPEKEKAPEEKTPERKVPEEKTPKRKASEGKEPEGNGPEEEKQQEEEKEEKQETGEIQKAEKKPRTGKKPKTGKGQDKDQGKVVELKSRRRRLPGERGFFGNVKLAVSDYFADLKSKGIAGKELVMIGTVILLAILMIVIVVNLVRGPVQQGNVTSDEGLTVYVRQEPETWCSSGLTVLDIRAGEDIQSVTINGTAYAPEGGRRAEISLQADSPRLDITVVTQSSTLTAQAELAMVDNEAPQVSVSQAGGTVTLAATDDKSGLEGIYYGSTVGLGNVPLYQKYTAPFQYQEGKTYYYYARDNAGNRTEPVATTMEAATALAFDQNEITLFPGESAQLGVSASPSGGYFNNPAWSSSDNSIATVDENGTVTAVGEGEAQVQMSADGLPGAVCQVRVRSEAQVTISALGDCTLGTDAYFNTTTSFNAYEQMYGSSYFFENVRSILSEDDITFANFEGTLTTLDTRENKQYAFKGAPSYTDILLDGSIEAVTLANNHSSDYGAQSQTDTKEYLAAAGIDYCTGDEIIVREVNGVKVGLIGIYVLDEGMGKEEQVKSTISDAKAQGAQVVAVAFHWGTEKSESPDETQISLAHTAIDSGADLVVGHHPHVLQGIEVYEGKYIVYSLGNFCFGGNNAPSDMDTMIFQQTFTVTRDGTVGDGGINIIPCSISSQSWTNDYRPTPATGDEAERIMEKINERSAQFGQTF